MLSGITMKSNPLSILFEEWPRRCRKVYYKHPVLTLYEEGKTLMEGHLRKAAKRVRNEFPLPPGPLGPGVQEVETESKKVNRLGVL